VSRGSDMKTKLLTVFVIKVLILKGLVFTSSVMTKLVKGKSALLSAILSYPVFKVYSGSSTVV